MDKFGNEFEVKFKKQFCIFDKCLFNVRSLTNFLDKYLLKIQMMLLRKYVSLFIIISLLSLRGFYSLKINWSNKLRLL